MGVCDESVFYSPLSFKTEQGANGGRPEWVKSSLSKAERSHTAKMEASMSAAFVIKYNQHV